MAPVNISQNDYLALSLSFVYYHFEEANQTSHKSRKKVDKILVLLSLSQYSFDFIFHITDLASTISILSFLSCHLSTLFQFWKPSCKFSFSRHFYHVLFVCKQNCIIPKLNSDWLIPIKVHPSFKKNRMRFYSIKVFFVRCHCQKSFQNFDQENFDSENFDSDNRP